jgi:hypothetical protein
VLTLLGIGGIAAAVYYLNTIEQNALLFAIIPGFGGLLLLSGGVATLIGSRLPGWRRRSYARRPCYVLTNQRAIIHYGGVRGDGVMCSYTAPQLARMKRLDSETGDMGSLIMDSGRPGKNDPPRGFLSIARARAVERLIRKTLLDRS